MRTSTCLIAVAWSPFVVLSIAYTPLIVSYTVEILPYQLRAKGFVIFNFSISLSLIFNQYVNPVALKKLGWKYYLVYVVWLAFELVYVYLCKCRRFHPALRSFADSFAVVVVETKGLSLEETSALFDGEEAAAQIAQAAHHEKTKDISSSISEHEKA